MSAVKSGIKPSELKKIEKSVDSTVPSSSSLLPDSSVDSIIPSSSSLLPEAKPESATELMIKKAKAIRKDTEPEDTKDAEVASVASEWEDPLSSLGFVPVETKKTDIIEDAKKHDEVTKEVGKIYGDDDKAKDVSKEDDKAKDVSKEDDKAIKEDDRKIPGELKEFIKFIENMSDGEFDDRFKDEMFKKHILDLFRDNNENLKNAKNKEVILKKMREFK